MAKIFVTGGSGFVGRYLIPTLVGRGDAVRALARSERSADVVEGLGAEAVGGDLSDVEAMTAGMEGCAVVFHLAAKVDQWGARKDFRRVNIEGTENVLEAARRAGVPRLVHVSTEAVLVGSGPLHQVDETRPIAERPPGLYPWSKAEAERRVRAANSNELTTVIVRPRFIWGKGDTSVLPQIIETIESGAFRWFDGGLYKISTCHVANVVEGMLLAAQNGKGGEVYFLTDGDPVEFKSFITRLVATQGVDAGPGTIPGWLAGLVAAAGEGLWRLLPLRGHPPLTRVGLALFGKEVTVVDAKARRDLGYAAHVSIDDGLAEMQASESR
jgi:nucleoside-diphosphate-sugar epimerase